MDGEIQLGVKLTPTDIKKTATQLQQEITKIFDNSAGKQTSKQFRQMEVQLDRLNNRSSKLQESLRQLETIKVPTQEYKEISKQIEKAQNKLNAYREAEKKAAEIGKPFEGDRLQSMQYEVSQLENTIKYAKGDLQELVDTGKAFTLGSDTQAYKNTANDLNNVNNQIVQTISATEQLAQSEEQLPEPIRRTSKAVEVLKGTMSKVLWVIEKIFTGFEKIVQTVGGKLVSAAKKALSHFSKIGDYTDKHQMSIKKLAKTLLKYGLGIRSVFILWRKLRTYTTDSLKKMATGFSDVNADVSMLMNSFNQMKNSFGTMAQPLLHALAPALTYTINLITSAITALANFFAIITGQKFIYKATKQNKDYAASVSGVGGAAKEANKELAEYDNLIVIQQDKSGGNGGGAGADAAAGMWEKVDAESDFAKQLKEAIKNQDWEGVGGVLADKLNIITKKFDDWIQNKFRPTAKKWASNIARILNGLVDGWDSTLFGTAIGHGLMSIADVIATFFETFKWKNLGKKVADAINGLFTSWESDTVARFFASKFNSVIEFVAGLIDKEKGINFKLIGTKIGQTLKRTIERINWTQLGADLSGLATGILEGLASSIKESEVGVTVGNAINEFLSGINFGDLAKDLSDLAINILDAVADCLDTLDWPAVGQAIADFLKRINWIDFITTLLKVALNLIKGLGEALIQIATDPEALLSIAEGLLAIFGAKWIWKKITGLFATNLATSIAEGSVAAGASGGAAGGGIIAAVKSGLGVSATAGIGTLGLAGASGIATVAGTALAGTLSSKVGGQIGAGIGGAIATALGNYDLAEEYAKEAENPFAYWAENIGDIFAGAGEVLKDGAVEVWDTLGKIGDDAVYAVFGDPMEKYFKSDEYKEYQEKMKSSHDAYLDMLEQRYKKGKKIHDFEKQMLIELGRITEDNTATFETDSKHYEDIAKSVAGVTDTTTQAMQESSNNYAAIVEQTASYYDEIRKQAVESSSYYAEIAKASAEGFDEVTKQLVNDLNDNAESLKENSENSFQTIQNIVSSTVDKLKQDTKEIVGESENMATGIDNSIAPLPDEFAETFTGAYNNMTSSFDNTTNYFKDVVEGVKTPFGSMAQYFEDTFTTAWGGAVKVFETNTPQFEAIQDNVSWSFKTMVNGMIDGVNNTYTNSFSALQNMVKTMRGFEIGGVKLFGGLPDLKVPHIPKLAQGAVLPPNQPFLAMVGDQKRGTNVEAPLETIMEALRQVLQETTNSSNNQPIVLQLNGNQIAQAVWSEEDKRYKQTGTRYR